MNGCLKKLASLGAAPLGGHQVERELLVRHLGPEAACLGELLLLKNGFYAFESALHVLPFGKTTEGAGELVSWNDKGLWIEDYDGMASGKLFFAEDVFGNQFCLVSGQVMSFDPETGSVEFVAPNLEAWAAEVLENYNVQTGYPLAHAWQSKHGPIPSGHRLIPKTLFVLGGPYEAENLYALEATKGMKMRASLAVQIRDLPDGAEVKVIVGEPPASI
ncbi:MAG: SMI1/KNR4 family protein [Polyangiaceae bacterium]|jgi:hypothetical protein|nr:SMI1/KNR4 family protein [Polyangiaceae bacterium]